MNIGIVTTWFERGAAYVSRQYREVLEKNHDVFIYARGGEKYALNDPRWHDDKVTWGKQGLVPTTMSMDLDDFQQWLKDKRIEAVLFNEQHWWEPVVLCDRLNVLTAAYIDYYTAETVPLFAAYDMLICNTRRHYSVFADHPQAYYVPWGTDPNIFSPSTLDAVEPDSVTFFHSSGMNPRRKGTDYVLRAFAETQGPAKLVIHAQASLEQSFPPLCDLVKKLKDERRLVLHEGTVAAPGLYSLGDVYVYPSRLDGIGLTVAEALACGLPVIATDNPPMNEFLDGTNWKLVEVESFSKRSDGYYWPESFVRQESLLDQMQFYVDHRARVSEFKKAARTYAEANLNWRSNASGLAGLFQAAHRIESESKQQALANAKTFERGRAKQSMRSWLSYHYPGLVRSARDAFRTLRPKTSGEI